MNINFFQIINLGSTLLAAFTTAASEFATGQPVALPSIRTYIGGKHVELDITVKPL